MVRNMIATVTEDDLRELLESVDVTADDIQVMPDPT